MQEDDAFEEALRDWLMEGKIEQVAPAGRRNAGGDRALALRHREEESMSPDEAARALVARIDVTRDQVARAKSFVLSTRGSDTRTLADQWLRQQGGEVPEEVEIRSSGADEALRALAGSYSLRLAFYQAIWELVAACEVFPGGGTEWWKANPIYLDGGEFPLKADIMDCLFPTIVGRSPLSTSQSTDPDIFLQGADCAINHQGIREAISQSLLCFRRGLYLPAIVMLAAAAEATWIECGTAIAENLGDKKLHAVVVDPFSSLSQKVTKIGERLQTPDGKGLLKAASTNVQRMRGAEIWTTTLRERRNAVHWGKAQDFIAQHSDASSLLLAAPLHLGTLEAVRGACV